MLERTRMHQSERGDTLIEIMFAFSILSAVIVGAFIIMNQGISTAQNSLEINLVRNQIDTQAELLRHLNNGKLTSLGRASNSVASQWDRAALGAVAEPMDYSEISAVEECVPDELPSHVFFIDPTTGQVVRKSGADEARFHNVETFAQVQEYTPTGQMITNMIWVEAVHSNSTTDLSLTLTRYYDFHIRACWEGSGPQVGLMKLGTIVRLYVPKV